MYLTLDIGNSRIKFVKWSVNGEIIESGQIEELWQIPTLIADSEAIMYCNVRGIAIAEWDGFTGKATEIGPELRLPFTLKYKTPETLGQDRLAALIGAARLYPNEDTLIMDAGTCLKFDLLTADKVYFGGSISPGLTMRYQALNHYTGRLPEVEHKPFEQIWGGSTEESILAGVQQGYLGEAEFRIAQFAEKYPHLKVIGTGGDLSFLADKLKYKIFAEPLIIHHGLLHCLLNP